MNLRVTPQTQVNRSIGNMQRQTAMMANLQEQISSSVRVNRPSDAPSDYVNIVKTKAENGQLDAYMASMNDAKSVLNESTSALTEANRLLTRAAAIASEGASASTDAPAREALAVEMDNIIRRAIDIGNTRADGKYLFGGADTLEKPFEVATTDSQGRPLTVTYNGSDDRARNRIGPDNTVDTFYAGNQIFQRSGADAFATLIQLRDNLRDTTINDTQRAVVLNQRMADMETVRSQFMSVIGEQSSDAQNLESLTQRMRDLQTNNAVRIGDLENTDYAEVVVRYQEQQNLYQATLSISSRMFDATLLDYLR
jgi:flagellar hook-associated protein 3 FlgL